MTDTVKDDGRLAEELRDLTDAELSERYGCDRFTATILASRLQYVIGHVCSKLLNNAFSPIIRDYHDFTATLSAGPRLEYITPAVAQTLPLFFGSMRDAVANSFAELGPEGVAEGDLVICNDTFRVGTHPNDLCFMRPVFVDGEIVTVLSIRAHMLDIGGSVPGGFSGLKRDIYENGLIVPPTLLYREDRPVKSAFSVILDNARFGGLLLPDMQSTFQALRLGESLIHQTIERYGLDAYLGAMRYANDVAAERARLAMRRLPDGVYEGVDYLDCDGVDPDQAYRVSISITKRGDRAEVDLSGTSQQARTSLNGCWPDVKTAVSMALKSLLDPSSPYASAWLREIDIVVPSGTLVASEPPAASMLYWEPILSIYAATLDAVNPALGARAQARPARGMHLHSIAALPDAPVPWLTALNAVGGWGANEAGDADSGQMSMALNFIGVDIETVENEAPVIHLRKEYATDSGGPGLHRGGAGSVEDTLWQDAGGHYFSSSRSKAANGRGALGGDSGHRFASWYWTNVPADAGLLRDLDEGLPLRSSVPVNGVLDPESKDLDPRGRYYHWAAQNPWVTPTGTIWRTLSDGGGGWGDPYQRDPDSVARDVRDGYVSVEGARRDYGVIVTGDPDHDPESVRADAEATSVHRASTQRVLREEPVESHAQIVATKDVQREPREGACPQCAATALAAYPVLSESGWQEAVKCQECLFSVSRTAWHRLGSIHLVEELLQP
jgi:N-methylhydantoinase B